MLVSIVIVSIASRYLFISKVNNYKGNDTYKVNNL